MRGFLQRRLKCRVDPCAPLSVFCRDGLNRRIATIRARDAWSWQAPAKLSSVFFVDRSRSLLCDALPTSALLYSCMKLAP